MLAESVIYNDSGPETVDMVPDTEGVSAGSTLVALSPQHKALSLLSSSIFVTLKG